MKPKIEMRLKIIAKPCQSKTELNGKTESGELKLNVAAPPEKGKANLAIIKFFKKKYGLHVEILSGKTSRKKTILLYSD